MNGSNDYQLIHEYSFGYLNDSTLQLENATYYNSTDTDTELIQDIYLLMLVSTALVAITVNVVVITSAFWIRRPIPPALKLSLSLAVSDASTSTLYVANILVDFYVIVELFRLTGILITVIHLFALSMNYFLGISKPLHYNSIVTRKKLLTVIFFLWTIPLIIVIIIFTFEGGFEFWTKSSLNQIDNVSFMYNFRFRMLFSLSLIVPIILMVICFTHILIIIKRHTKEWLDKGRKGSTMFRGRPIRYDSKAQKEKKRMEGNIKAVHTTLLIIGSCVLGWMPAIFMFVLICKYECYLSGDDLVKFNIEHRIFGMTMRLIENMLVLLKMLVNPIIYCIRMKEIQDGIKRMFATITRPFHYHRRTNNTNFTNMSIYRGSPSACSEGTLHVRLASIKANGSSHVCIGRTDLANSFL